MKGLFKILASLATVVSLTACKTAYIPVVEYRDSVRLEVRSHVVHDTAVVEIPAIREKIITRDTVSWIENDYATSYAEVTDGFLIHKLDTKPQQIQVPMEIPVSDTLIVESHEQKQSETIEVEKKLSEFQKFQMRGFWVLLALLGLLVYIRISKLI